MGIIMDLIHFMVELAWTCIYICLALLRSFWRHIIPPGKKSVQGQVVLVTGAARGIGREIALQFGLQGAKLALVDINTADLTATVQEFRRMGFEASACQCNISDYDDVTKMAAAVTRVFGNVDILVNNAGVLCAKPLLQLSQAEIQRTLDVNLKAHFWTTKRFLPGMIECGSGHIISVASMAGKASSPFLTDYAASKYGVVGFSDTLRDELKCIGQPNIHVTTICPMFVNTRMIDMEHAQCGSRFDPILEPSYVAKVAVDGVLRNYETIYIPWRYSLVVALTRIMPTPVIDAVRNLLGAGFVQKRQTEVTGAEANGKQAHSTILDEHNLLLADGKQYKDE